MEIEGYKCFYKGLLTQYGDRLEIGKAYTATGEILFGKNGYHFCERIEDTFRYFDTFNEEVDVCRVKGSSQIKESFDDYNEYYDLYCAEKIIILEIIPRNKIIEYGLNLYGPRAWRFVSTFYLNDSEIELFMKKNYNDITVLDRINAYQKRDNIKIKRRV